MKTFKEIQKELKRVKIKKRDQNIIAHLKGEINLGTRKVKNKKKYTRKIKHKNSQDYFIKVS